MPWDSLTVKALSIELNEKLTGSKIYRIHQPDKNEVILRFSDRSKSVLLLAAEPSLPRAYLTKLAVENPDTAPAFCMLLRKYLSGGLIKKISQHGFDRVIEFRIEALTDAAVLANYRLIVELTGRICNIVLVNEEDNRIIDAIRRVPESKNTYRQIMPGSRYVYPPNDRLDPFDFDESTARDLLSFHLHEPPAKALSAVFIGLSPKLAQSIAVLREFRNDAASLIGIIREFAQNFKPDPRVYRDSDGAAADFSAYPYAALSLYREESLASISEAAEIFYKTRAKNTFINRYESVIKRLSILLKREEGKLSIRREEKEKASGYEINNVYGNLLLSSIHEIKRGDRKAVVVNYYDDAMPEITIPLKENLNPSANAQFYFKRYTKERNALRVLDSLIEEAESNIHTLSEALFFLRNCEDSSQGAYIIDDLTKKGFLRQPSRKSAPVKELQPARKFSSDGREILIGRNSRMNDVLTFRIAAKDDIWLHAKNIPGSHVILKTNGGEYSEESLLFAASVAAWYSTARDSSNVPVDYTYVKHVRKPAGSPAGKVIFTNNRTLYVFPKEEDTNVLV